jgi:hypothetical protein
LRLCAIGHSGRQFGHDGDLDHVSVHADDLDESVAFYEQLFGLGNQQLHLFLRPDTSAPRFHHVGPNVDDFEAV